MSSKFGSFSDSVRNEINLGGKFSSVNEILMECNTLIETAEPLMSRIDVRNSVQYLKESCEVLQNTYSGTGSDEDTLYSQKLQVCEDAIKLEYVLIRFYNDLKQRYMKRVEVNELYSKVVKTLFTFAGEMSVINPVTAGAWANLLSSFAELYKVRLKSVNIIFNLSEEEDYVVTMCKNDLDKLVEVVKEYEVNFKGSEI